MIVPINRRATQPAKASPGNPCSASAREGSGGVASRHPEQADNPPDGQADRIPTPRQGAKHAAKEQQHRRKDQHFRRIAQLWLNQHRRKGGADQHEGDKRQNRCRDRILPQRQSGPGHFAAPMQPRRHLHPKHQRKREQCKKQPACIAVKSVDREAWRHMSADQDQRRNADHVQDPAQRQTDRKNHDPIARKDQIAPKHIAVDQDKRAKPAQSPRHPSRVARHERRIPRTVLDADMDRYRIGDHPITEQGQNGADGCEGRNRSQRSDPDRTQRSARSGSATAISKIGTMAKRSCDISAIQALRGAIQARPPPAASKAPNAHGQKAMPNIAPRSRPQAKPKGTSSRNIPSACRARGLATLA